MMTASVCGEFSSNRENSIGKVRTSVCKLLENTAHICKTAAEVRSQHRSCEADSSPASNNAVFLNLWGMTMVVGE